MARISILVSLTYQLQHVQPQQPGERIHILCEYAQEYLDLNRPWRERPELCRYALAPLSGISREYWDRDASTVLDWTVWGLTMKRSEIRY